MQYLMENYSNRWELFLITSDDIGRKLDTLIKLQAAALMSKMESAKERIVFLSSAGLGPSLIAEIIGTTANHVNVTLSAARKADASKHGKDLRKARK